MRRLGDQGVKIMGNANESGTETKGIRSWIHGDMNIPKMELGAKIPRSSASRITFYIILYVTTGLQAG